MFRFKSLLTLLIALNASAPTFADNLDDARQITDRAMSDYYQALKRRGSVTDASKKDIYDAVVKPRSMEAHEKRTGWLKSYLTGYGVETYSHDEFFKKFGIEASSQKDIDSVSEEGDEVMRGPASAVKFDLEAAAPDTEEDQAEEKGSFAAKADQAITGALKAIKSVISPEETENKPKIILDGSKVPDKIIFSGTKSQEAEPVRRSPADVQAGKSKVWYQDDGNNPESAQKGADGQAIPNEIHFGR